MRRTRTGSIQAAVGRAYRAAGGLEAVARDLSVALSTLSYGTEVREDRPGGLGVNYLDRLGRIEPEAAVPLAEHFARLAGGVYHSLPADGPTSRTIAELTREFGLVLQQHADAHSAGSADPTDYTPAEAREAVQELDRLLSVAASFRAVLTAKAGD
jgi:hypothetical protein